MSFAAGVLAGCSSTTGAGDVLALTPPSSSFALARGPRFDDHDPHDWSNVAPWHHEVHGIDVAKYQGTIDWRTVRGSGIDFAFIKATEGGDRVDDRFAENWNAAAQAGVARGAYHFFYMCRTGGEQADWFIRNVPKSRGALPPVLDAEWNPDSPSCKRRPPKGEVRQMLNDYLTKVRRHYRLTPIVYVTVDFYADNELWKLDDVQFWLRSVADHPSDRYPDQDWVFWQYTGTGKVPGIRTEADINAFAGTRKQWQAWLNANS